MKYKLLQETKPKLSTFGKYKAVAVHQRTVSTKEIAEECADEKIPLFDEVVYKTTLCQIAKVVKRHLRNGDKVGLDGIGLLKLEIESDKVDNPSDFNPKKHIRGARVHFIPESIDGVQDLYDEYEREKK